MIRASLLLLMIAIPASAQAPKSIPAINPAAARLDQTIANLDGPGFAIAYSPEQDLLVAGCDRGTIQFWSKDVLLGIRTGSGTGQVLRGHDAPITALAWNGGPTLVSWATDRKLVFWAASEGKPSQKQVVNAFLRSMAMSPDGKLLATGGDDALIQLWDVASAKPQAKLQDQKDWITSLVFSADSKLLASGAHDGTIVLWEGGKKLRSLPTPPMPPPKQPADPSPVSALAFSADGKTLAAGYASGNIDLINLADGKTIRPMAGHTSSVTGLAFHPTGTVIASSSKDRTVRLWNPANGQAFKVLEGHGAWVEGVVFTNQFTRLASVSADQTVRIWDLAEPAKK